MVVGVATSLTRNGHQRGVFDRYLPHLLARSGLLLLVLGCGQPNTGTSPTSGIPTAVVQTNVTSSPAAIGPSPAPSAPIQIVQVQVTGADAVVELQNTGGPTSA